MRMVKIKSINVKIYASRIGGNGYKNLETKRS